MTTTSKPNALFWVIAIVLGLLWNLMGVGAYLLDKMGSPELLGEMYTPEQMDYINAMPMWATALYAIAVWGGFVAAICMLLRKKLATLLFLISTLAVVVSTIYGLAATNHLEVFGPTESIYFPILIIVIGFFLYFYCKRCVQKGWLK